MAVEITDNARSVKSQINFVPNIVVKIDGVDDTFGAATVYELVYVGEPDLEIGDDWLVGGFLIVDGQKPYLSTSGDAKSTTVMQNKIAPDKGSASAVTKIKLGMVDENNYFTNLITPGKVVTDIIGRGVTMYFGFQSSDFPDDHIKVFRGVINEVSAGPTSVMMEVASIDEVARQSVLPKVTGKLQTSYPASGNVAISLESIAQADSFPLPYSGHPSGQDDDIRYFVRIDDELIEYETKSGSQLTTITRGEFTSEAAHDSGATVSSITLLKGVAIDLVVKLLMSGKNGDFVTGVDITNFVLVDPGTSTSVANSLFFIGVDLARDHGVSEGDYATVTGSSGGLNDFSDKLIVSITKTGLGSYCVIDGVTLTEETGTSAVLSVRSQYDTLGHGLGLSGIDVDVDEFNFIKDTFLSSQQMEFFQDGIPNIKDFIEKEILLPLGCFSIPRKGKYSLGYHIGPYPDVEIVTLNKSNIINAEKLKVTRSISNYFINTIEVNYDYDVVRQEFDTKEIYDDTEAKAQIDFKDKTLTINAKGIKSDLTGEALASNTAEKMLNTYSTAAEYINGVKVNIDAGFVPEVGDIVILDTTDLNLSNMVEGDKEGVEKFMRIYSKRLDMKSAQVTYDLVNTSYGLWDRFGFISPSSVTGSGSTTSALIVERSFGTESYQFESKKWSSHIGNNIRVTSSDFATEYETVLVGYFDADPATLLVSPALPAAPGAGWFVDVENYSDANAALQLKYYYISPSETVTSGASSTVFDVSDSSRLWVGAPVSVHSADWTTVSAEARITDISTNTITVDTDLGFTPSSGMVVDLIGFKSNEGEPYRII